MATKDRLHQLIHALPDSEIDTAERLLTELSAGAVEGEEMTAEDRLWLETDKGDLWKHEPYEWGPDGPPSVTPVKYVPGVGLIILSVKDAAS